MPLTTLIQLSPPIPIQPFVEFFRERHAQANRRGYLVSLPAAVLEQLQQLWNACRAGAGEEARSLLSHIRSLWGGQPQQALDDLVQGLTLTREVSPALQRRVQDALCGELASVLAHQLELALLERDSLRLGRPPHEDRWMMAETLEDAPSTLALLAQTWNPERCEFWIDGDGVFTADPARLPQARLLRKLDYASAKELARLHHGLLPNSEVLAQLQASQIPFSLHSALSDHQGTSIEAEVDSPDQVHAVVCQMGLTLLSVDSEEMWRKAGFLARLFQELSAESLSIDLLATSQTNVSLTLDPTLTCSEAQQQRLQDRLGSKIQVVHPCAAVTLVGRRLRSLLPRLGGALGVFDEQQIHLVNQASSDVSLTFVVDEDQAERLLRSLHQLLFVEEAANPNLGPSWQQLHQAAAAEQPERPAPILGEWWVEKREQLLALAAQETPVYIYDAATISSRAQQLEALPGVDRRLYAIKANPYRPILEMLWQRGFGLECVSPGELERILEVAGGDHPRERILYTPNFAPRRDYELGLSHNCWTTLDSLAPLEQWPDAFQGREVFLRLDPGKGAGHHRHVQTGGKMSKFGISLDQLEALRDLLKSNQVTVKGLHCHVGSGILEANNWFRNACFLAEVAGSHFPEVEVLDLGGGLGVPDRPGRPRLDLGQLGRYLEGFRKLYPHYKVWMEPGRFMVAESGVLLASVTQIKRKGERFYIGVDAGMHSLIRPSLYGAYHHIVNLTRWGSAPRWRADIVGPICESGDVLGRDRWLPETHPGDVLLIATAGAYGYVMSSHYNLRGLPKEMLLG